MVRRKVSGILSLEVTDIGMLALVDVKVTTRLLGS
jgi:hypothetical protein